MQRVTDLSNLLSIFYAFERERREEFDVLARNNATRLTAPLTMESNALRQHAVSTDNDHPTRFRLFRTSFQDQVMHTSPFPCLSPRAVLFAVLAAATALPLSAQKSAAIFAPCLQSLQPAWLIRRRSRSEEEDLAGGRQLRQIHDTSVGHKVVPRFPFVCGQLAIGQAEACNEYTKRS